MAKKLSRAELENLTAQENPISVAEQELRSENTR